MLPTFSLLGIRFTTFPFVIFLALTAGILTFMCAPKYKPLYRVTVFYLFFPMLIFGGVGSRLVSAITLLTASDQSFWHNLIFGGSVFYGGLIGGALGLLVVCRIKHYEFLLFSDLFVTILPISHSIGRLGCYLNGCCYGSRYTGPLAAAFVVNGVETTVFPTWFLESGFCALLFLYFQFLHKNNATGMRTAIYAIAYSVFRFILEYFRGDEIRGHFGILSSSQIISIFLLITGLCILYISIKDNCDNYLFNKEREDHASETIPPSV